MRSGHLGDSHRLTLNRHNVGRLQICVLGPEAELIRLARDPGEREIDLAHLLSLCVEQHKRRVDCGFITARANQARRITTHRLVIGGRKQIVDRYCARELLLHFANHQERVGRALGRRGCQFVISDRGCDRAAALHKPHYALRLDRVKVIGWAQRVDC